MNKTTIIILTILLIGILFRLVTTLDGNFLFNMDNARDMVDVREMVVLHKLRLTGPTSAIEGFFNGPAWYYLLAVPFVFSGGNPYAAIILEIGLWAIGGFFLLKLVSRWDNWLILPVGLVWVASDYILLATSYAFNPNPVTLLAPLFVFLLVKYLKEEKIIYGISTWFLGGLFFNFEMNFGVFIPFIILISIFATKKLFLLKQKGFLLGLGFFVLTLLPQIIFDLKHEFLMSKAIMRHLSVNFGNSFNLLERVRSISLSFFNTFSATLMNYSTFALIIIILAIPALLKKGKDTVVLVSAVFIAVPFLGYLFLPVTVNPWHLGGEMAVSLILIAYLLKKLKIISIFISGAIIFFGLSNIANFFINDSRKPNLDPSLYRNEIAAIDYVYKYANSQNFKVYTYLPSVYDYPYQYLFWWYGKNKYGYVPGEYAYAPDKPPYIPSQDKFQGRKDNLSNLVFLIKEPNRGYNWKSGWEADYRFMELISSEKLGSIDIEVRREIKK